MIYITATIRYCLSIRSYNLYALMGTSIKRNPAFESIFNLYEYAGAKEGFSFTFTTTIWALRQTFRLTLCISHRHNADDD